MTKKLLLADDSVTIQKVVSISFANEDVEVATVDNGDDALANARESAPDIVLADVQMPGLDGYALCEALKQEPSLRHVPVLLLSGTFENYDEDRARAAGAAGHVSKPFEAQVLVERVNEILASTDVVEAEVEAEEDPLGFDLLSDDASEADTATPAATVLGQVEPIQIMSRPADVPVDTVAEPDPLDAPAGSPDATVAVLDDMPPPLPDVETVAPAAWDADDAFDWPTEGTIDGDAATRIDPPAAAATPPPLPELRETDRSYDEIFDFDIERGTAQDDPIATASGENVATPWEDEAWTSGAAEPVPVAEPWEDPAVSSPSYGMPDAELTTLATHAPLEDVGEVTAEPSADPGVGAAAAEIAPALRRELQASLEKVAWDAFGDLSERVVKEALARIEAVAWEVIPQMAETLVREEIRRLKNDE